MSELQVQDQDQGDMLIPTNLLEPSKYAADSVHDSISGSSFLSRIQLMSGSSNAVKRNKARPGTYVIVQGKDNIIHDLGEQVDMIVLNWIPKAIDFKSSTGKVKIVHNVNNPIFKEIEAKSKLKNSGAVYGPAYLVYVPAVDVLCEFHFNSVTLRQEAGAMKQNLGKGVTLRPKILEKESNVWNAPVITTCSTPLLPPAGSPEREELLARFKVTNEKFINVREEEDAVEPADTAEESRAR